MTTYNEAIAKLDALIDRLSVMIGMVDEEKEKDYHSVLLADLDRAFALLEEVHHTATIMRRVMAGEEGECEHNDSENGVCNDCGGLVEISKRFTEAEDST